MHRQSIPMPLADTLLRMAEAPRHDLPKWSHMVMDEATRNLIDKWSMEPEKAQRREEELRFGGIEQRLRGAK